MNIILIAPPAAGKGTYASMLHEKYGFTHISAGDVLREEVLKETLIGKEIKNILSTGNMIDDNIMKMLIKNKLESVDLTISFMLDGYPRKLNQSEDYEEILSSLNLSVDKVLFINIDKDTGLKRVLGRRVCPKCKRIYNIYNEEKPKVENTCDECFSTLITRSDDTKETYENRYNVYMNETKAVIKKYKSQGKLIEVDGSGKVEVVFNKIVKLLGVNNG